MGAFILTTLPRSSIRHTISIPNFCADAHFWGMALNLSPSFTLQMMVIILLIAFRKGFLQLVIVFLPKDSAFKTLKIFHF